MKTFASCVLRPAFTEHHNIEWIVETPYEPISARSV
jgi:hypothetical protein